MTKAKRKQESYMSYRALRDLHSLIFVLGNFWYWGYWLKFYGFSSLIKPYYFFDLLPFTIIWTVLLGLHIWVVQHFHELSAERDALKEELEERERVAALVLRLRDMGEISLEGNFNSEKLKNNHHESR